MRSKLITLAAVVLITFGLLIATLVAGWGPLLGLDLQGGVSVVLEPTEEVESDTLDQAISIIRQRVDGIGVAEPEITRQGNRVVVALPGTDDQERALELVGTTAEVRFRPVCSTTFNPASGGLSEEELEGLLNPEDGEGGIADPDDGEAGDSDDGGDDGDSTDGDDEVEPDDDAEGDDTAEDEVEPDADDADADGDGEDARSFGGGEGEFAFGYQDNDGTPGVVDEDLFEDGIVDDGFTDDDAVLNETDIDPELLEQIQNEAGGGLLGGGCVGAPTADENGLPPAITDPSDDEFDDFVVLPDADQESPFLYVLGPARTNGEVIRSAEADVASIAGGEYLVNLSIGGDQRDDLDALAGECFTRSGDCLTGQMAVTLDGEVVTAPNVNIAEFSSGVQITGNFDQNGAEELALVLRFGSLPVELEPINQQTVSATIGEDALRAGLVAGVVGLSLVALYMLFFYRVLGAIAIASLIISSAMLWIIVAYLGEQQGLALTLAGITGIIVSFGVSLDSNVVVFENLKESVRNGKSVRSIVDRSFANAYSTIVKADFASLIGAVLLYFLTIGSVRGFALFLGIATILDLVVTFLFLRPAISWLGHSKLAAENPSAFGVPEPGSGDLGVAS